MQRIWIATALAVIALAATSAPARANQTIAFDIVGAGSVASGPDNAHLAVVCSRSPGAPQQGNCQQAGFDGTPECNFDFDPPICVPTAGLTFQATPADGFAFTGWTHPQCNPPTENPCGVSVSTNSNDPVLHVTATFADTRAPIAAVTSPADGAAVRGVIPLTVAATDNAAVTRLALEVRGNAVQTFGGPPFTTTFDTRTVADGAAAVSATASDAAGNTTATTANVTIDNTNPTLTVTGPDGQTLGPATVPAWTIDARDATTAVTVRCSVVPVGQPANLGACTSATEERLPNQPDGRYTLTVRATDAAGNFVEHAKTFGVDTGPPETTITSGPRDGAGTTATALTWGFAASEPSTFECRLYLTAVGPGPFGPCSAAGSHSVSALAPGGYTFEVRATDAFGNLDASPARRTVTVTLAPPPPPPPPLPPPPPPPVVQATLTFAYKGATRRSTQLTRLVVTVPAGASVTARCPKGCARRTLVLHTASGKVSLKKLTGAKPLKARTTITVIVAKPGAVAAVKVLEIRKGRGPTVLSLCQPPGAAKPGRCG